MKEKVLKIFSLISVIVLSVLLTLVAVFCAARSAAVYAETAEEVIRDLRKDKDFSESAYPYVKDDHGLYVIQIAESSDKELFVYAYQPCHDTYDLVGTKISISYGYSVDGSGLTPQLYNLRLLSTSGTLDKYYVEGFTVPNDGDRYYNIVEIFRMVNAEIDQVDEAFPKTDIAYSVGQQWYVCDLNDSKHYEMNTFNTLFVETVWNDKFNFSNGFQLKNMVLASDSCDAWFYSFNVEEYVVKHIYDADLNYSIRDKRFTGVDGKTEYSNERVNLKITLKDTDKMSFTPSGLGAPDFEWHRILSSKEFVEIAESQGVSIDSSVRENVLKSQWVFSYLETGVNEYSFFDSPVKESSDVYDVGLLRLHFQDVSGEYYDLGVVNDLTDPDDIPGGYSVPDLVNAFAEFWEKFVQIVLIIFFVILLVLLLNFVAPVMSILKFILKGIGFVLSAPFKLLKSIFKKDG